MPSAAKYAFLRLQSLSYLACLKSWIFDVLVSSYANTQRVRPTG